MCLTVGSSESRSKPSGRQYHSCSPPDCPRLATADFGTRGAVRSVQVSDAGAVLASGPLFRDALLESPLPSLLGGLVAAHLFARLRPQRGNWHRSTVPIDGDEGEVARIRVAADAGDEILRLHAHADFHRGPSHVVNAGFHD